MREQDEEAAWRSIVENFGERARLDAPEPEPVPDPEPDPEPQLVDDPEPSLILDAPEERFVPPPPPPLPQPRGPRGLAWVGVLASPLILVGCVLASITLPSIATAALVAGFVGGFTYLVTTMDTSPRDAWDDGSQV